MAKRIPASVYMPGSGVGSASQFIPGVNNQQNLTVVSSKTPTTYVQNRPTASPSAYVTGTTSPIPIPGPASAPSAYIGGTASSAPVGPGTAPSAYIFDPTGSAPSRPGAASSAYVTGPTAASAPGCPGGPSFRTDGSQQDMKVSLPPTGRDFDNDRPESAPARVPAPSSPPLQERSCLTGEANQVFFVDIPKNLTNEQQQIGKTSAIRPTTAGNPTAYIPGMTTGFAPPMHSATGGVPCQATGASCVPPKGGPVSVFLGTPAGPSAYIGQPSGPAGKTATSAYIESGQIPGGPSAYIGQPPPPPPPQGGYQSGPAGKMAASAYIETGQGSGGPSAYVAQNFQQGYTPKQAKGGPSQYL